MHEVQELKVSLEFIEVPLQAVQQQQECELNITQDAIFIPLHN